MCTQRVSIHGKKIVKKHYFCVNFCKLCMSIVFNEVMSDRNKNITTAMMAIAGVGVCYVLAKYRADILRQIRLLRNFHDRFRYQQIHVVNNAEDCRKVLGTLKS